MTEEFPVTLTNGDVRTLVYRLNESGVPDGWYLSHGTIQYQINIETISIDTISPTDQERLQSLPNKLAIATDLERFTVPKVTAVGTVVASNSSRVSNLQTEISTLLHKVLGGA